MRRLCLSTLLLFFAVFSIQSDEKQASKLDMFIWSSSLSPILSTEHGTPKIASLDKYQGIIKDIISSFSIESQIQVDVHLHSRERGERLLYAGELDFTVLAPSWVKQPESLVYSNPVYIHKEYLYALQPIAETELSSAIEGKTVCTRLNYSFPKIQPYFDSNHATRLDSQEEELMFKLLLNGRCEYLLTNEFVGSAIIEKNNIAPSIYRSSFTVDEVGFTFAFHPQHSALLSQLNAHVDSLRENGQLIATIELHRQRAVALAGNIEGIY